MKAITFKARRVVKTTFAAIFTLQGGDEQTSNHRVTRELAQADADALAAVGLGFEVVGVRKFESVSVEPLEPWRYEELLQDAGAIDIHLVPELV